MTTGTTLDDWDGLTSDYAPYGSYYKKVWGGGDSLPNSGFIKENDYTWQLVEAYHTRCSVRHPLWFLGVPDADTSSFVYSPGVPTISDYPINKATGKVWDLMTQSKFNAGVFAGEFRETVDFITSSFKAIAGSYFYLRRGNFKEAARILVERSGTVRTIPKRKRSDGVGMLANNWLAYQYALIPLLSDIKSAYEYLTKTYRVVSHVKAAAEEKGLGEKTVSGMTWVHEWSSVSEIRCHVFSEVSTLDRLGLTDPASVLWELTRLSFVIDWIIPIGNFLKAVNARRSVQAEEIMITNRIKESLSGPRWTGLGFKPQPVEVSDFSRVNIGSRRSLPLLPVELPMIENPLGLTYQKYLSASSLLSQTFGRH